MLTLVMLRKTTEQMESTRIAQRGETPTLSVVPAGGSEDRRLRVCAEASEEAPAKAAASMAKKNTTEGGALAGTKRSVGEVQGLRFKVQSWGTSRGGGLALIDVGGYGSGSRTRTTTRTKDDFKRGGSGMKKLTIMTMSGVLAAGVLLTGCMGISQSVPKTKISGDLKSGRFSIQAPKNASINGFELSYSTNETRIKFTEYKAEMDPNVVEQSGKAQAAIIAATRAIQTATEKAVEVLKK